MGQAEILGIIFDMDGVIADTDDFHFESWQRLAIEEGIAFNRDDYLHMRGRTREDNIRQFTRNLAIDDATRAAWFTRKNHYFQTKMHQLQPGDEMPGISRLITEARQQNLRIGVGSSSKNARPVLERLHLIDRFDAIADGYTVTNSKPAPDIFVWVAGALGISPRNTIVIEDSPAGVDAARAGGFFVVGVGSVHLPDAHLKLDTLADISLTTLIAQVIAAH